MVVSDTAPGPGSPDRRVKRRLRESVQGFRSLLFRRKCLNVVGERVKGEKTVSPFTIPAVPQRNRCCALRSPPGPQPAVGSTRHHCLDSPLSAIPGGQPLSSVLRFADFSGHQGIAAYHVVSETYPQRHENLPEAARCACPGYSSADGWKPVAPVSAAPPGKSAAEYCRVAKHPRRRCFADYLLSTAIMVTNGWYCHGTLPPFWYIFEMVPSR